jgi:hypothetical protein
LSILDQREGLVIKVFSNHQISDIILSKEDLDDPKGRGIRSTWSHGEMIVLKCDKMIWNFMREEAS